ncbi:MAG: SET domain-containing protein-lysine N-methyltransferase [Verrucomicrobiota bacterium]
MSKKNALLRGESCHSEWCEVRRSGVHGRGLFAKKAIPKGTYVIEYVGERIGKDESNERGWAQMDRARETGDAAVYIFTLDDDWDIDGNVPENAARLMNHSCKPNCEAFIEEDAIWIAALNDIPKNAELFFNYGFDLENYEDHPCGCGAENCIGFIAGEDYWPSLRRKLAAKKAWKKRRKKGAASRR